MIRPSGSCSGARVIVLGHIVRGPVGGMAWHHLQYALGLARLGHEVYFFEDSQDYPACYDPSRRVTDVDPTYGLRFAERAFAMIGLPDRWAYYDAHAGHWLGPAAARALHLCAATDVLLNMSGKNPMRPWYLPIPHRVLIDTDPAFTQIRHLEDHVAGDNARQHTAFFTFGENIPTGTSSAPDDGLPWQPTRQPIVLDQWPVVAPPPTGKLTTVMLWDSYRPRRHGGVCYDMKSRAFAEYLDLPRRIGPVFELAVGGPTTPKQLLRGQGWQLVDPLAATSTPDDYRTFLQRSRGEFSVAKHGYVVCNSGWFSERSAAYLASGRPVVVQDTGFSERLPVGSGLLAFRDIDEAIAAVAALDSRYAEHSTAARDIAAQQFDSNRVLDQLLADVQSSAGRCEESR